MRKEDREAAREKRKTCTAGRSRLFHASKMNGADKKPIHGSGAV
jgi:hypothetical protein